MYDNTFELFYYFTLRPLPPRPTHTQTPACAGCIKGSEHIVFKNDPVYISD